MLSLAGIPVNDLKLYIATSEGADKGRAEKMCRILDEEFLCEWGRDDPYLLYTGLFR